MPAAMDIVQSTEMPPELGDEASASKNAAPTPPTSEDMDKRYGSSSPLSELDEDEDEDIGEIEPDHYWDGGVPVFKPTMAQFKDFRKFIDKIDKYGMKSGIVKVIPPQEWRDNLPSIDEAIKRIKIKNPITQEFAGQHGIYTQANIEKQRSYNLPQWKALTYEPNHQPPAKRGERRRQEPVMRTRSTRSSGTITTPTTASPERAKGRPTRKPRTRRSTLNTEIKEEEDEESIDQPQVPPTPTSPNTERPTTKKIKLEGNEDETGSPTKSRGRQPKSISSRRKNNRRDAVDVVDEAAFKGFDYHLENLEHDYSAERCRELEETYWRTINYGQPMYGADMPGSLFDDDTLVWNVANLPNLLDVLGTKVPGVNTAYLYLGMWKATFAWHLEDVDLYSINYIHFGAPKQWYSISQADARKFEAAMKRIWPRDAKNCDQFLRHKTYLISPTQLEKQYNIKPNKLLHFEGEFVITFPYGYHSGYNLGYNCAESVNFANDAWLNYGRIAKKCECEADSVWVDVNEVERKLRGEPTPEFYEETDDDEEEPENALPSPPPSIKAKSSGRKRKRESTAKEAKGGKDSKSGTKEKKKIKIRIKLPGSNMPCILCPNDISYDDLLPTDNGQKAHRSCALYTPETFISEEVGEETVCNVTHIDKARLDLKCNFCRSKRGACFQCSHKKCTRAFHSSCAVAAGVLVDMGPMPHFAEDGTEYSYEGYDFRCRFHRPRRPKTTDADALEANKLALALAKTLKSKNVVQVQYIQGEVFGGVVIENRPSEKSILIDVLPDGDRIEVEWKYVLALDPEESQRPKPSANAKPLPSHMNNNDMSLKANNRQEGVPEGGEPFNDPNAPQKWAEFNQALDFRFPKLKGVNLDRADQPWHYLGKTSTEARAQYTEDPSKPRHNLRSNFLESVKPPPPPMPLHVERRSFPASYPSSAAKKMPLSGLPYQQASSQKPYEYKPKPVSARPGEAAQYTHTYPTQSPNTQIQPPSRPYSQDYAGPQRLSYFPYSYTQPQMDPRYGSHQTHSPAQPYSYPKYQTPNHSPYAQSPYHIRPNVSQSATPQRAPSGEHLNRSVAPSQPYPLAPKASGAPNNNEIAHVSHLRKFPYLLHAYLRRPKKYVSPYKPGGGFSEEFMPISIPRMPPQIAYNASTVRPYQTIQGQSPSPYGVYSASPVHANYPALGASRPGGIPYQGSQQALQQTPRQSQVASSPYQAPTPLSKSAVLSPRLDEVQGGNGGGHMLQKPDISIQHNRHNGTPTQPFPSSNTHPGPSSDPQLPPKVRT